MGRVTRLKYAWTNSKGERIERVTTAWYVEYTDAQGKFHRKKAGTTKEQATDVLRKLEGDVLNEKNGLPTERASGVRCHDLRVRYLKVLKPRVSQRHLEVVEEHLLQMLTSMKAVTVQDIKHERVERFLAELDEKQLAARTVNHYLSNLKAMLNWAVRARIIQYNPIASVMKRSEHIKKRVRRPLSDAELARLLAAAADGPRRRMNRAYREGDMDPAVTKNLEYMSRRNVLIYKVLVSTGLRLNELRSLRWADVNLTSGVLTTQPWWAGNKNGKQEELPLAPSLVVELENWRGDEKVVTEPVLHIPKQFLRTLNDDLVAAGIAKRVAVDAYDKPISMDELGKPVVTPEKWIIDKRDAQGRVIDLHALRHTFGTRLVANGVDIKTTQSLMRHSTPNLTLGVYVHKDNQRLAAAVGALPRL